MACWTFAEILGRTSAPEDTVLSFCWTVVGFGIGGTVAAENDQEVSPLVLVPFRACLKDFL